MPGMDCPSFARTQPVPRTADVAIVGGGIAGASLATALADAGLDVVLIEREARFRDRVRGEALHPWGAAEADRLGLVPVLRQAGALPLPIWQRYEARLPVEPYRWETDLPGGAVEWGVPHPALQEALLAHAGARTARLLRPATAVAFRQPTKASDLSEVVVSGLGGEATVRTLLVVGAGGSRAAARAWLGAHSVRDPIHHLIGGCLLEEVALDRDRAHQAYLPGGMVTIFPQGAVDDPARRARGYFVCDPAWGVTCRGSAGPARFLSVLASAVPEGSLAGARPAGPLAFFSGIDDWADRLTGDGLVLIGDAAGANDPSQGHGLSLAFRDARELRDLLLAASPADWPDATRAFAARRLAYAAPLRAHARWAGLLTTEQGPEADYRRAQVDLARESDPSAGGYAGIFAFGPDGLSTDEAARRRFFGEEDGATSTLPGPAPDGALPLVPTAGVG